MGDDFASVERPFTTSRALREAKANDAQVLHLMQHPKIIPTGEGWQNLDIRSDANLAVRAKMETQVTPMLRASRRCRSVKWFH